MEQLSITWIFLPFLAGFIAYLLPNIDRYLAVLIASLSIIFSCYTLITGTDLDLVLLDSFGVSLSIDTQSGYFILTNGLVSLAVMLYCWEKGKSAYFYTQLTILHGSINSVFCCADFITAYVALEVVGIAASLLISYPRNYRSIWIALRYLFISNTVMLFYLIGAVLIFQQQNSFAFTKLGGASPEAIALILLGLLTKGGIFLSGMWLPMTHAETDSPISALLSGIVVKAGVFPIARCAQLVEELAPIVEIFSVGSATIGVILGMVCRDVKRIFAFSTISQLGYVLAGGEGAGFYAFTHGLAKAGLFLGSGNLNTRKIEEIDKIPIYLWLVFTICSMSIVGIPLLAGFSAKALVLDQLPPWQNTWLSICSVGTTIVFCPIVFISFAKSVDKELSWSFKIGSAVLIVALVIGNFLYLKAYNLSKIVSSLITVSVGVLGYHLITKKVKLTDRTPLEKFEHLIGIITITTILVFTCLHYELP